MHKRQTQKVTCCVGCGSLVTLGVTRVHEYVSSTEGVSASVVALYTATSVQRHYISRPSLLVIQFDCFVSQFRCSSHRDRRFQLILEHAVLQHKTRITRHNNFCGGLSTAYT